MPDKFTATWVSHSSINDFLSCPRAYYLKNVYKDPSTGKKIQVMTPPLALGQIVHEVLEALSKKPVAERFRVSLVDTFEQRWKKVQGKRGGFASQSGEERYKERGRDMLRRVMNNPGPLAHKAVKIREDLPQYWISEEEEIILCGKIDWLEYLAEDDAVHIIDFKTGKSAERSDSLQLPIYYLLVTNTQQREVQKASYWYLAHSDELSEKRLPDPSEAYAQVMTVAKQIKLARKLNVFKCPEGESGCRHCTPFERVLRGEAEHVGQNSYGTDVYILEKTVADLPESDIL